MIWLFVYLKYYRPITVNLEAVATENPNDLQEVFTAHAKSRTGENALNVIDKLIDKDPHNFKHTVEYLVGINFGPSTTMSQQTANELLTKYIIHVKELKRHGLADLNRAASWWSKN